MENNYPNAFKEVDIILKNTEECLYKKIPKSFIKFIEYNKNDEYNPSIDCGKDIDKQKLLPKTEAVISLIYRSFLTDEKEKIQFKKKNNIELKKIKENNKNFCKEINKKTNKKNDNNKKSSLILIEKENLIKRMYNKILKFLNK